MGCDYYIYTYLEIIHTGGTCYYQLKTKRGYYSDFIVDPADSDEDYSGEESERVISLKKIREEYEKIILKPAKPKILYEDNKWTCKEYESKYRTYVDTYIDGADSPYGKYCTDNHFKNSGNELTDFANIIKVNKVEHRIDYVNM